MTMDTARFRPKKELSSRILELAPTLKNQILIEVLSESSFVHEPNIEATTSISVPSADD